MKEIEMLGGDASRVYLGGMALGSCIAITTFLQLPKEIKLGGVFGFGGAIVSNIDWSKIDIPEKKKTPLFLTHCAGQRFMTGSYLDHSIKMLRNKGLDHI
jgi:predicted esterase